MNKKIFFFLAGCLPILAGPAVAADADDIVAMLAEVHQAYIDCDADALQALAHPNWLGAFGPSGKLVKNTKHEQVRAECAQGNRLDYQYEVLKMEVHGNWAFVVGLATAEVMAPDGNKTTTHLRVTWIMARHEGKWKRYHVHLSAAQPSSG